MCSHNWVLYTGLREEFHHCKHCGIKQSDYKAPVEKPLALNTIDLLKFYNGYLNPWDQLLADYPLNSSLPEQGSVIPIVPAPVEKPTENHAHNLLVNYNKAYGFNPLYSKEYQPPTNKAMDQAVDQATEVFLPCKSPSPSSIITHANPDEAAMLEEWKYLQQLIKE